MADTRSLQDKPDTTLPVVTKEQLPIQLLDAALDGDREAWDMIVAEYNNLLWWIARSHRLDDATSADVVQTVWLQLVQHGRSIRDPERLAAWLATTARREARRRVAASNRQVPTADSDDEPARNFVGPEERVIDNEVTAAALAAFHRLGPTCQQLMMLLCEVPPKSYAEISAILDIPTGSIGPSRQRCLASLRAELRGLGF